MDAQTNQDRLQRYALTDEKYNIVPVPTPLPREVAIEFVSARLSDRPQAPELGRLVRLAVFYNLRECVADFVRLLKKFAAEPKYEATTHQLIVAIAWLGNPAEREAAAHYFDQAIVKINLETFETKKENILDLVHALAPGKGLVALRQVVNHFIEVSSPEARKLLQEGRVGEARNLENRIARLQEFLHMEFPRIEAASRVRSAILNDPDHQHMVASLAELYLGGAPASTPRLRYWAALMLLRVKSSEIAAEFLKLAEGYRQPTADLQAEFDLYRARALRAAHFYSGSVSDSDHRWLIQQMDPGTDQLALRPKWPYPGR